MLPGFAYFDAAADFGAADFAVIAREVQALDTVAEVRRRFVAAFAVGYEEREFFEHSFDCPLLAVVPADDALRGVASADEDNLRVRLMQLTSDLDEQAFFGDSNAAACKTEHLHTVFQRGSVKFLVRISARHGADHLIDMLRSGFSQGKMGARERVERSGEDSEFLHRFFATACRCGMMTD